ncbi:hypothetical protein BX600DRAFT_482431 [Xylariales sp. PMI_506]|nr:hypothetical protein BX600DRAFT_482431 [Xylariales sp. PMI_506]
MQAVGGILILSLFILGYGVSEVRSQDNLGLANGYLTINTTNFNALIVKDAQVLASLKPAGNNFDFLPFDYLPLRVHNGQYHFGDITFRYRQVGKQAWVSGDSAAARKPVTAVSTGALAAANLAATLPAGPLNITREWIETSGDLGLRVTVKNSGSTAIEIGSFGFPAEFNSIFTNRYATDMQALCSLSDPYIGMDAGYIQATPLSGTGSALVVTALNSTPLEAYRNLVEPYYDDTAYGSQVFEGFYEWQALSKAWAENEWAGTEPWNEPSSRTLQPNESTQFALRFTVATGGIRDIGDTVSSTGTPTAISVPGYILPRDNAAQLFLQSSTDVASIAVDPSGALTVAQVSGGLYSVTPSSSAWGRARVTISYADGKTQTIHYYVVKAATEAVSDLGEFLTTEQWFENQTDPFGRSSSVMTYDYEVKAIVTQDDRVWIAGLSDEAGAGAFLSAMMKQAIQPNAAEIAKLETFVDEVLWGTIQTPDYAVRKSIFYYQPSLLRNYTYSSAYDWTGWESWDQADAYATDRAYDYVHVAASYWALYRAARAYPDIVEKHDWEWYLNQSYSTIISAMKPSVGYNDLGLMGETVFGQVLADLTRENQTSQASALTAAMKTRATLWNSQAVPYGSEMSWDSTGEEGVYYWSKYFGYTATVTKTVNAVLGYMPTVAHWGWNGNARRYWDNLYGGKLRRIERQIHHYGSGLNALVLLGAFRSDPSDTHLIRVGYGGISGPLSSINDAGFAAASFHSFPETLAWDAYSGDYGPNFVGLALGSGTYVVDDPTLGLVSYGGALSSQGGTVSVKTKDPVRQRVFIGPLGLLISVDAGIISQIEFETGSTEATVTLSQLDGAPIAAAAILWLETTSGSAKYTVTTPSITQSRGGWQVPLGSSQVSVVVSQS